MQEKIITDAFIELIQIKLRLAQSRELQGELKSSIDWLEEIEADIAVRAKELREDNRTRPRLKRVK